ncbi:hypothetical protein P4E94_03805 [Pontiellaceae bacterium B12219]|nr:hypothetical protein [Pontiellaceae bacterium B12219]
MPDQKKEGLDSQVLWKPHSIKQDEILEIELGALRAWIHRGKHDWHIAHTIGMEDANGCHISVTNGLFDPDRDWMRWILDEKTDQLQLKPQLPDRPLIVRPEMPMCLMPRETALLFIGIPVWLGITFGAKREQAVDIPTSVLSNSWFGSFTDGELCYAIKTWARQNQADLLPNNSRVVFPLEVRNASSEKLKFERLCIRPQNLNIYQGNTRLWTNKGRVSYRGEENWSRLVYAPRPPEYDQAAKLLCKAREPVHRGAILQTFDNFKQRVDLS